MPDAVAASDQEGKAKTPSRGDHQAGPCCLGLVCDAATAADGAVFFDTLCPTLGLADNPTPRLAVASIVLSYL
jgi:hypothetical protein